MTGFTNLTSMAFSVASTGNDIQFAVDNFTLDEASATVPVAPASLLMVAGFLGMSIRRRGIYRA